MMNIHIIFFWYISITPDKEKVINQILEDAIALNPNTDDGFNTSKLKKIKNNFLKYNSKLRNLQPHPLLIL